MQDLLHLEQKRDEAPRFKPGSKIEEGRSLETEWRRLCARYLPVGLEDSVWRMSRGSFRDLPEQGWKLHVSATVLSANLVLKRVAPYLYQRGLLFKAPSSLHELSKINCGLYYGFMQVGKFITVYPRTDDEAVAVARDLHELTYGLHAPLIPFDIQFCAGSIIYYRYGSFKPLKKAQGRSKLISALRTPSGKLTPDARDNKRAFPAWVINPFDMKTRNGKSRNARPSPLKTTIRAYEALSQRGKGGVYRALDLSVRPARFCVLKEGRRHGETDWDGRDGRWLTRHEARVLNALRRAGVRVPQVYTTFEVERHFYLVTEFIEGVNLQSVLSAKRGRLKIAEALEYGIQSAELLKKIHAAGWVWRDCKPLNLIVTANNQLRPVDFEIACRPRSKDNAPWGSPGYVPPEVHKASSQKIPLDLYALGATLHQLFTGHMPDKERPAHALTARKRIPSPVRDTILALLSEDPQARPDARTVSKVLRTEFRSQKKNGSALAFEKPYSVS